MQDGLRGRWRRTVAAFWWTEAMHCRDEVIHVVGAGNSAGQAAMFFAEVARRVVMLVRSGTLEDRMSHMHRFLAGL